MPIVSPAFIEWLNERVNPELFSFSEMNSENALKQLAHARGFDALRRIINENHTANNKQRAVSLVSNKQ